MYRVELSFAHRQRTGDPLLPEEVASAEQQSLNFLTEIFKGGQLYHRLGGYKSDEHLFIEPCTVVWALAEEVEDYIAQLWALARSIAGQLKQECVLLTITPFDGIIGWVPPNDSL